MNEKIKVIRDIMISAIVTLCLYIFLHEFGHTIVILACGGRITKFSILTAHVSSVGGMYTDVAALWLNANGVVFPVSCSYLYMLLYRSEIVNKGYRIVSFFVTLMPTCSILAWVFIPLLFLNGSAPAGDDCTKFLEKFATNNNPLWVTVSALLLIGLGITLMLKKKILANYVEVMKTFKQENANVQGGTDKSKLGKSTTNISSVNKRNVNQSITEQLLQGEKQSVGEERTEGNMKKTITITTCIIACIVVLIGGISLIIKNDTGYKTNGIHFEQTVTVSDGVAEPAMSQVPIPMAKSSDYSFLLEWELEQPGLLSGINVVNTQGESVFWCTGDSASIESVAQYFEAGEYMLEVYYLTSEEAADDFFKHVGSETEYSGGKLEYEFAENGQWEMEYEFSTFDVGGKEKSMTYAIIMGMIIGLLLVVIILAATKTDDTMNCNFDERQEVVRGKGFKYGFFTLLICNGIFAVLNLLEVDLFAEGKVPLFLSIVAGVAVFACYCIWNDGYFSLNENRRSLMIVFAVEGIVNIVLGILHIHRGEFLVDGSLTFNSLNFFCGILAIIIFAALFLKKIKDDREE